MRQAKARRIARAVLPLLKDGRPKGCTCPPNRVLPADCTHWGAERCPYTAVEQRAMWATP